MTDRLRVLDLFSGIGGFSLGLERAGMKTVAFCETDPLRRQLLNIHWPKVPCYEDVRSLSGERLAADGIAVDLICGGFPCQDLSKAGARKGLSGSRSGLWFEFERIIGEVRPLYVIIENVVRLRAHGLDTMLSGLAALGYDAEWHCISAASVGSPTQRDRLWVLAYAQHPHTNGVGSHPAQVNLKGSPELQYQQERVAGPMVQALSRANARLGSAVIGVWRPEPGVRRVVVRSPAVVERLKALGNTVEPRIPELIGRAILQARAA